MIPIFLSADNNYAMYLCVVIKSICEHTDSSLHFCILDGGINDEYKNMVKEVCSSCKNVTFEFINPDSINVFSNCRVDTFTTYISKAAFYRLLLPDLKPDIDKAIYLDVDLVVNLDIKELFNQDMGDYIIGAIYEECNEKYHSISTKKNLEINIKHKYFNSGVLLIDCKKWRENNITQKLKDTYDRNEEKIMFHDQDILNLFFSVNNYCLLDKKFNYFIQEKKTDELLKIIHYFGPLKPWQFLPDCETDLIQYCDVWWNVAKTTGYIDLFKEKCTYKDKNAMMVARLAQIHRKMHMQKIEKMYDESIK